MKLTTEAEFVDDLIDLNMENKEMLANLASAGSNSMVSNSGLPTGMSTAVNSMPQMPNSSMQMRIVSPALPNQHAMNQTPNLATHGMQAAGLQSSGMQSVGIGTSVLNSSMVLQPLGMGQTMIPIQGIPQSVMPNQGMGMPAFPAGGSLTGMTNANVATSSLFMGPNMGQSNNNNVSCPGIL